MSMNKSKNPRVSYRTIVKALDGDAIAMEQVLAHYRLYICKLFQQLCWDSFGNEKIAVDEQLQRLLELHLIITVLKFKIR
ncbi:MAG: helix-turn-helix domain-containing protein [Firmicutes bacterium]|nr:helix-turn-helix domain-containing protein [Bacillota bacterium]